MKKYLTIIKLTIADYMAYRMNFFMWRLRQIMRLLILFFLWAAIYSKQTVLFSYSENQMFVYILLSGIIQTLVMGTTTLEISWVINQGVLTNILLKPMRFLEFYMAKDVGDKLLNFTCAVLEFFILFLILRPHVFLQTHLPTLLFFFISIFLGMLMYFYFSIIFGFFGFWSQDVWAPRFLSLVIIEFFSGGLFPLDILPKPFYSAIQVLPFPYLMYFPLSIYLGKQDLLSLLKGISISIFWIGVFMGISKILWNKGLQRYEAQGR